MESEHAVINIGHGDPTIFRSWWEESGILPLINTQSSYYYEYQEQDCLELIVATHNFHALFGTDCLSSSLVYGNGSTQVINAILYTLAKRAKRSIVIAYEPPVYMLMHEYLTHCNFVTVTHDLTRDDIDVEIVIDPNNPSGEHREQKSKAQYIIFDRAYNWPIYCEPQPTSSASNHITVYTISKSLGMGGLRLGWAFINDLELTQEVRRALFVIGICPNSFSLQAAYLIFQKFIQSPELVNDYTHTLRSSIRRRRSLLSTIYDFTITNESGPYAWIRSKDGRDIAKHLLDTYRVKVYSGTQFGSTAEYARLSLICSDEDFSEAFRRFISEINTEED